MRRFCNPTPVLVLALSVGATGLQAGQLKSESEFRDQVVGHTLTMGDNSVVIQPGGTTEGTVSGQTFKANWMWQNGMYCRNAALGTTQLGTDCQVVSVSGDTVSFTGQSGKGQTSHWTKG